MESMTTIHDDISLIYYSKQVASKSASIAMIFGGVLPYIPQYRLISSTRNAEGFSIYVCLSLLIANILRLCFWFGHPFDLTLVLQSVCMIICMLTMLELCIRLRSEADELNGIIRPKFIDCKITSFWEWKDFSSYLQFLTFFILIGATITRLFIHISIYVEALGFLSVLIEAMLAAPQFYRNFINKSTLGMSISMVIMWTIGDLFKTFYFIFTNAPIQFWVCGMLQVSLDLAVLGQVLFYNWNKKVEKAVTDEKTDNETK